MRRATAAGTGPTRGAVVCGERCGAFWCPVPQRASLGRQTGPLGDEGMSRFLRRAEEVTCQPRTGSVLGPLDLGQ